MTLLRWMLLEEYRLHTGLFGGARFLGFPVAVATLVGISVWLLGLTGTSLAAILAGIHLLVLFLGLQVGTIGLVGRDAMRNLLGDVTLLVFSGRTLPISRRRLLSTFLAKDLLYYAGLFLTPLVVGFLPLALSGHLEPVTLGLLWVTTVATFALGAGASLTLVGVATRSKPLLFTALAIVAGLAISTPALIISLTPYGTFTNPTVAGVIAGIGPATLLCLLAPVVFEPPARGPARRVTHDQYGTLTAFGADAHTTRPLLEVLRSSGSVWKVAFSLGLLFAVTALLLEQVAAATGLTPSAGIAFGTLLGLGTFTTYNWVTQFDDPREYLRYPLPYEAVFAGKQRAFLVYSLPTGVAYLGIAALWYPATDLLVGLLVFPLVSIYVFWVTAFLTGLAPNELLFDTPLFAAYGAALAALAVPLLVASLAFQTAPLVATAVALTLSLVAAGLASALATRTGSRWERRLRSGE